MRFAWLAVLLLTGCMQGPTGVVEGTAELGPTCPVEQDPPDPECADQPFEGSLRLLSSGKEVRRFDVHDGAFRVRVAPGTYTIEDTAESLPTCHAGPFEVHADETTTVHVDCDTGIR